MTEDSRSGNRGSGQGGGGRRYGSGGRGGHGSERRGARSDRGRGQPGRRDDRGGGPRDRGGFPRGGGRAAGSRREEKEKKESARTREEAAGRGQRRDGAPELPENVLPSQLDSQVRSELGTLPRSLAETVARHLVMTGALLEEDPERAYEHARYARRKASRVGAVREVAGLASYRAGKWQEALSDLRAARRMTGRSNYLAIMADCERGLGRPERALELAHSGDVAALDVAERVEVKIVAAGARRDLGEKEAALVELQGPELKERRARPWTARLFYAYADALLELGREEEAREYFARASAVDREGVTDADERLAELEGVQIVDVGSDVVWSDAEDFTDETGEKDSAGPGPAD